MSVCERCTENGNCAWQNHDETICREKPAFPATNAYRIRAMTDEELAKFFLDCVACDDCPVGIVKCKREFAKCMDAALDWLRQEASDGN